jgi:hypothetical protein
MPDDAKTTQKVLFPLAKQNLSEKLSGIGAQIPAADVSDLAFESSTFFLLL